MANTESNLSSINFMSEQKFNSIEKKPDELYAIPADSYIDSRINDKVNSDVVTYINIATNKISNSFTAPSNGWLLGATRTHDQTSASYLINGITVSSQFSRYNSTMPFFIPIKKGQIFSWSGGTDININFMS